MTATTVAISIPTTMGAEHRCILRVTAQCTPGTPGMPKRKKCPGCGGELHVFRGLFGVFAWRGDGRYFADGAVALYARESSARKHAERDETYVVRFVSETDVERFRAEREAAASAPDSSTRVDDVPAPVAEMSDETLAQSLRSVDEAYETGKRTAGSARPSWDELNALRARRIELGDEVFRRRQARGQTDACGMPIEPTSEPAGAPQEPAPAPSCSRCGTADGKLHTDAAGITRCAFGTGCAAPAAAPVPSGITVADLQRLPRAERADRMRRAHTVLAAFQVGATAVLRDERGREHDVTVSYSRRADGDRGSWESHVVGATLGPGRYTWDVTVGAVASGALELRPAATTVRRPIVDVPLDPPNV